MASYRCKDGDMLDWICARHYGPDNFTSGSSPPAGVVETVLAANPHLADLGPVYPAGTLITLPDIGALSVARKRTVRLWGDA